MKVFEGEMCLDDACSLDACSQHVLGQFITLSVNIRLQHDACSLDACSQYVLGQFITLSVNLCLQPVVLTRVRSTSCSVGT